MTLIINARYIICCCRCEKARSCVECVALQDPHCAWSVREDKCLGAQAWSRGSQGDFLQSVPTGQHAQCPPGATLSSPSSDTRLGSVINQVRQVDSKSDSPQQQHDNNQRSSGNSLTSSDDPTIEASVVLFSLETLIITVSAGAVAALVVGFVTGKNIQKMFNI